MTKTDNVKVGQWEWAEVGGVERYTLTRCGRVMATVVWSDPLEQWDVWVGEDPWSVFAGLPEALSEGERATGTRWAWRGGPDRCQRDLVHQGRIVGSVQMDPLNETDCGWTTTWHPGDERPRDCGEFSTAEAAVEAVQAAARYWVRDQRTTYCWTDWAAGSTTLSSDAEGVDEPGGIGHVFSPGEPGGQWTARYWGTAVERTIEYTCETRDQAQKLVEDWAAVTGPVEVRQGRFPLMGG